jgi:hypothetical protein
MPREQSQASTQGHQKRRSISCDECTIQIGEGYQEALPFEFKDDEHPAKPRVLTVCWRCWESLNRRKNKRLAQAPDEAATPRLLR